MVVVEPKHPAHGALRPAPLLLSRHVAIALAPCVRFERVHELTAFMNVAFVKAVSSAVLRHASVVGPAPSASCAANN